MTMELKPGLWPVFAPAKAAGAASAGTTFGDPVIGLRHWAATGRAFSGYLELLKGTSQSVSARVIASPAVDESI